MSSSRLRGSGFWIVAAVLICAPSVRADDPQARGFSIEGSVVELWAPRGQTETATALLAGISYETAHLHLGLDLAFAGWFEGQRTLFPALVADLDWLREFAPQVRLVLGVTGVASPAAQSGAGPTVGVELCTRCTLRFSVLGSLLLSSSDFLRGTSLLNESFALVPALRLRIAL